jgi:GNAT superfamily N-acetyltransferase
MITLHRTNSENPDFIALVKLLDADLAIRDGADHAFYAQFNKIDAIRHVVLAYEGDMAVGCGAIKEFSPDAMEVKRMFVRPEGRQKGIASMVLGELERWAAEMSYRRTVLETGMKQQEAIELYTRRGYTRIPNYGQYAGVENSLCFEKILA